MKKSYQINGITFSTKGKLEEYAKGILYSGNINDPLIGDDFLFMFDYFKTLHVEFDLKEGCGIKEIVKIVEPMYGKYRGFKIIRLDETETDISYKISNISKKSLLRDLKEALRQVVEPQVHEFKLRALSGDPETKCPFTGEKLSYGYSHVDHDSPTFHELVKEFCMRKSIDESVIPSIISEPSDNQLVSEITDDSIRMEFWDFHAENANLRLLSPTGNLSHAKRNDRPGN